jgi:2-methylfumaryl-CoA hydratase
MRPGTARTTAGRFFEDFRPDETIVHAVPQTLSGGERGLYHALFPARGRSIPRTSSRKACGLPAAPMDDPIAFHTIFGKTVPDISLNAVVNLG